MGLLSLQGEFGPGNHQKLREEHFILNLERLVGRTDAVTPDTMMEFCVFIHNENVAELLSIEQDYSAVLLNDSGLDMMYLIGQYYHAKKEKNEDFLRKLRDDHRSARNCLDLPDVKNRIRKCIENRKAMIKNRICFQAFHPILDYFQYFGNSDLPYLFARTYEC